MNCPLMGVGIGIVIVTGMFGGWRLVRYVLYRKLIREGEVLAEKLEAVEREFRMMGKTVFTGMLINQVVETARRIKNEKISKWLWPTKAANADLKRFSELILLGEESELIDMSKVLSGILKMSDLVSVVERYVQRLRNSASNEAILMAASFALGSLLLGLLGLILNWF